MHLPGLKNPSESVASGRSVMRWPLLFLTLLSAATAALPHSAIRANPPAKLSRTHQKMGNASVVRHFDWTSSVLNESHPAVSGGGFRHLTTDPSTGRVYVGGVNQLFQLDRDLVLESTVVTGPRPDSPHCHASGCPDSVVDAKPTDNTNKVHYPLICISPQLHPAPPPQAIWHPPGNLLPYDPFK